MNLTHKKGITLVEMIVTMVLGSMLIFILGTFIGLGSRSYAKVTQESGVNSSLMYGLKLIQNRVHKAKFLSEEAAAGEWLSEQLICNNEFAFGIYQDANSDTMDFVYLPDKDDVDSRQVILAVPEDDAIDFTANVVGSAVTVTVSGTLNETPFNLTSIILRRN